jgi:hypothetical protein
MSEPQNPYAPPREAPDEPASHDESFDAAVTDAAREAGRALPWLTILLAIVGVFTLLLAGVAVTGIAAGHGAAIGVTILFLCICPALLVLAMWGARRAIVRLRSQPSEEALALALARCSTVLAMLTFLLGLMLVFQAIGMIGALL